MLPSTKCARDPVPPAVDASDNDWVRFKRTKDAAGADCRDKLDAVDAQVQTWPKPGTDRVPP